MGMLLLTVRPCNQVEMVLLGVQLSSIGATSENDATFAVLLRSVQQASVLKAVLLGTFPTCSPVSSIRVAAPRFTGIDNASEAMSPASYIHMHARASTQQQLGGSCECLVGIYYLNIIFKI